MMNVLAFGVLGMLTSVIIGLIVSEVKRPMLILLLIVQGMFFGWIAGVIWFYMTGAVTIDTNSVLMPVFISAFFTIIILTYLPKNLWNERFNQVGEGATVISIVLLLSIAFIVAFSAMPVMFASTFATEQFNMEDVWQPNQILINDDNIELFSVYLTNPDMIDFQVAKKSINGLKLMDEPTSKNYMDFQVTMDIKGIWAKPYLKIAVFEDRDNDGKLSVGDVIWADTNYKIIVGFSNDKDWRVNCIWEDGKPVASAFTTENHILPIFHAKTISKWQDETNVEFGNTPEGYTCPYDMFSWEKIGDKIYSKETVMEWSAIEDGQTTIKGRVYCPYNLVGNNYILIRAYDASLSDPTDENANPIASKIIPFHVSAQLQNTIGSEWYVLLGLGGVFFLGVILQRKKEWF